MEDNTSDDNYYWWLSPCYAWYWKNYHYIRMQMKQQELAYWRASSIAFSYENNILHKILKYFCGVDGNSEVSCNAEQASSDSEMEEVEMIISEEMLEFMEHSERHRRELKKQREKKTVDEKDVFDSDEVDIEEFQEEKRKKEMSDLYGTGAPMILGMETAMQLNFERACDKYHPVLWPNIPINL